MWKYVVNTVRPRTFKWLVAYDYDSNGSELSCDTKGANYGTSLENSGTDKAATLALKYAKEGKIPAFKIGTDWRFHKKYIDQWIKEKLDYNANCKERRKNSPKKSSST